MQLFKRILSYILMLLGLAGCLYSMIMQIIISYNLIGGFRILLIPHISLLGLLGIIPMILGYLLLINSYT